MMRSVQLPIRSIRRAALLGALLALAGCGSDVSRTFGLTRDAPDEFTVTTRAPLSMPPDFSLRPPRPGAPRPQEMTQQQQAEAALAPGVALQGTGGADSPGQDALVQAAGPPAPHNIRQQINADANLDTPSRSFTDRLMFWKDPPPAGTLVDPTRETKRLQENAALGRSVETGDTPIIQRKRSSIWDIF
jgi:hypothetical protein